MATQVETLLPGNPLAKAEGHGKVIRSEPEKKEGGRCDGTKRQAAVTDCSPGQGGTTTTTGGGAGEQTSKQAVEQSKGGGDSDEQTSDEGGKESDKKEFTEAPPPKVNPWTRKVTAVTVVSVNGQAALGTYPPPCGSGGCQSCVCVCVLRCGHTLTICGAF